MEKGLVNFGENNCFVNSVIQVLWHLRSFRESFSVIEVHNCPGEAHCVFCALQTLFLEFVYRDSPVLSARSLRAVLARLYHAERRFQLGDIADASECLDAILQRLHLDTCGARAPERGCVCPSHAAFGLDLRARHACPQCGHAQPSEALTAFSLITYSALLLEMRRDFAHLSFAELLRRAYEDGSQRRCARCGASSFMGQGVCRAPAVLSVCVVWQGAQVDKSVLRVFLDILSPDMSVDLARVLPPWRRAAPDARPLRYRFRGMVCYYGMHYLTVFYSDEAREWVVFDDQHVRRQGARWAHVVEECVAGALQPTVLFFERDFSEADALALLDDAEVAREDAEIVAAMKREEEEREKGKESEEKGEDVKESVAAPVEAPADEYFEVLRTNWFGWTAGRTLRFAPGEHFYRLYVDRLTEREAYTYADVQQWTVPREGALQMEVRFRSAQPLYFQPKSLAEGLRICELLALHCPQAPVPSSE